MHGGRRLQILRAELRLVGGQIVQPAADLQQARPSAGPWPAPAGRRPLWCAVRWRWSGPARIGRPAAPAEPVRPATRPHPPQRGRRTPAWPRPRAAGPPWRLRPARPRRVRPTGRRVGRVLQRPPPPLPGRQRRPGLGPDDGLGPRLHHLGRQQAAPLAGRAVAAGRPPGGRPGGAGIAGQQVDLGLHQQRIGQIDPGSFGREDPLGEVGDSPWPRRAVRPAAAPGPVRAPAARTGPAGRIPPPRSSRAARRAGHRRST